MTRDDDTLIQAERWFVALRDETADAGAWLTFQDWLEADPRHAAAYDSVEALWVSLDEARPEIETASIIDLATVRARRRLPAWIAPGMAAAAALAIMVGVWAQGAGGARPVTYATQDQTRTLRLDDGSVIDLDRHSALSVTLERGRRTVVLTDGEAAFDVAHDASRPFVVEADGRRVEVLGTAFDVVNHAGRFSVGVSRGRVSVSPQGAPPVVLTPGQGLRQDDGQAVQRTIVDAEALTAWRDGVMVYRDAPIAEVAADLSRRLGRSVTVAPSATSLRFTGVLQWDDEGTMVRRLEDFLPVTAKDAPDGVILTAREVG